MNRLRDGSSSSRVVLLLALPRAARADFFVIPFAGMKFGGSTSIVDLELAAGKKKLVLGVAALKIDDGIIGFEAEFGNIAGLFRERRGSGDRAAREARQLRQRSDRQPGALAAAGRRPAADFVPTLSSAAD